MASLVLIEGSTLPSVWLSRGQRRIVPWTRHVRNLRNGGYVIVLASMEIELKGQFDGPG